MKALDRTGPSITCPVCGLTSYHPKDIAEGYCGNCHDWTGAVRELDLRLGFTSRSMYYDRQGVEITFGRWVWLSRDRETYHWVKQTERGRFLVSTIWEGINKNFGLEEGPPIVFESAILYDGHVWDGMMPRASTEEQALEDHENLLAVVAVLGDWLAAILGLEALEDYAFQYQRLPKQLTAGDG